MNKQFKFEQNTLHEYLPEAEFGGFKVFRVVRTPEQIHDDQFRSIMLGHGQEFMHQRAGTITVLRIIHGDIVMSDSGMEWATNRNFVNRANGHVLIAGLGLGWIVRAIQDKPEVTSIIVIEKEEELIQYCTTHWDFNEKVRIYHHDIFEFKPDKSQKWDTVYFDIWNSVGTENHEDMKLLHRRFSRHINRENPQWMLDSWRKQEVYRAAAEERQWKNDYSNLGRRLS